MNTITFEEFLKDVCFRVHPSVLDDDMPDFFENWIGKLDVEDYMKWGEIFGREQYIRGQAYTLNKLS